MLDLSRDITLVDDRCKGEDVEIKEVAYSDISVALLLAYDDEPILVSRITGVVLTTNYQFYFAENQ